MAANYIAVNSKFKPFSYAEMLQPVQMATLAHQEVENEYAELATKANIWDEMANEQTDPYAYKMYKTYSNDLEEQAGQLAREGLNAASRRDMLNMRARYSKEITPIEQAYTARQKQAEEQQKALLQDPTLMLSRRASTTSLDDYKKVIYDNLIAKFGAGATTLISNFGHMLYSSALQGYTEEGFLGIFTNMLTKSSAAITGAIVFAFIIALVFKPKD